MTDFVRRVLRPETPDFPVRSLLDVDFYKFTMGQFLHKYYPNVDVTFAVILRSKSIPLMDVINQEEMIAAFNHLLGLSFTRTDLSYLRGMNLQEANMFSEDYLKSLAEFRLPQWHLDARGEYTVTFSGKAPLVSHWETLALSAITELYFRSLMREMTPTQLLVLYTRATDKLYRKFEQLKRHPGIKIIDFGTRRRHSFLWQQKVVEMAKEILGPNQFLGTSNTYMAFHHDLEPKGTNAHELPMVATAIADTPDEKRAAQYMVLEQWQLMYGQNLRICLPDTYGSTQFLEGAPDFVTDWKGFRQDSGDPYQKCREIIDWWKFKGADAKKKLLIPSDGLDVPLITGLHESFSSETNLSFGMGTLLTNDFIDCFPNLDDVVPKFGLSWRELFRAFSVVCKVVEVNGRPAVKLSDNIEKATGPADEVLKYKQIFGNKGLGSQEVLV